jgi:hypothetical protein
VQEEGEKAAGLLTSAADESIGAVKLLRRIALTAVLAAVCGGPVGSAQAATVIGRTGLPVFHCWFGPWGMVQGSNAGSVSYVIPFDGTITSFSAPADIPGTRTKLLILQWISGETYKVVAKSDFGTFSTTGVQTFPTQIPVKAGQVIGAYGTVCAQGTGNSADFFRTFDSPEPTAGTDTIFPFSSGPGLRVDLSATVEPFASVPPATASPSGQRAAALKKCKKRVAKGAKRKKCIKKAKKLPV